MIRRNHSFAALVLACAPALAQQTIVVDRNGGPGVDFTDIPPAIAAASAGDRIVVRGSFLYSDFTLGKGLDLEATGGARVEEPTIANIPAGQWARVAGFQLGGGVAVPFGRGVALNVSSCTGPVLLSNLNIPMVAAIGGNLGGINCNHCSAVLILDCTIGSASYPNGSLLGYGVTATASNVGLERCTIHAAPGVPASLSNPFAPGGPGHPGILAAGSSLFVSACTVTGGKGGAGVSLGGSSCIPPGPGGPAIAGDAATSGLIMGATALNGGPGGTPGQAVCATAAQGAAITGPLEVTSDCSRSGTTGGTVVLLGRLVEIRSPGTANLGGNVNLTIAGPPLSPLILLFDAVHTHRVIPGIEGVYFMSAQRIPLFATSVGAGGTTLLPLSVPNDPTLRNIWVFFQGVAFTGPTLAPSFTSLGDLRLR